MRIIGIIGGVASGKSAVSQHFAALGAGILDADRAGHAALRLPEVERDARQRWGDAIFGPDGKIDRARLAKIVFADGENAEQERKCLEKLVHPRIAEMLRRQADAFAALGKSVAILDAALLVEAGWNKLCDKIVFVDATPSVRLARALARGWTEAEFAAREKAQTALDEKRTMANAVIDNSGTPEEARVQVEKLWDNFAKC